VRGMERKRDRVRWGRGCEKVERGRRKEERQGELRPPCWARRGEWERSCGILALAWVCRWCASCRPLWEHARRRSISVVTN